MNNVEKNRRAINRTVDVRPVYANRVSVIVSVHTYITCRHYIILRKEGDRCYQTTFEVITAKLRMVFSYGLCRLIN